MAKCKVRTVESIINEFPENNGYICAYGITFCVDDWVGRDNWLFGQEHEVELSEYADLIIRNPYSRRTVILTKGYMVVSEEGSVYMDIFDE